MCNTSGVKGGRFVDGAVCADAAATGSSTCAAAIDEATAGIVVEYTLGAGVSSVGGPVGSSMNTE